MGRLRQRAILTVGLLVLGSAGAAVAGAMLVTPGPAEAQRLRANIYITQQRIPPRTSERGLLGWARGHQTKRLVETREPELDDREWRAELIVNFTRPPDDLEFHILYYDIEDGPRRFVDDMTVYVNDRNQETYVQRLTLDRPRFSPNRRMELVVTVRRQEVGKLNFELLGEERRNSGEVSFSAEEADPNAARRLQQQEQNTAGGEDPVDDMPEDHYDDPGIQPGAGPGAMDGLVLGAGEEDLPDGQSNPRGGGCGCSTTEAALGTAWPLALSLLFVVGRRRR